MGIRRTYGMGAVAKAAQAVGQARASEKAMEQAAMIQAQQIAKQREADQRQYEQAIRKQDLAMDIMMQERAKAWEIEKMEIASRNDFQREEQMRQRKLDSLDSALQQIDKEVMAGHISEEEAYPIKLKYQLNKMGVDIPVSMLRQSTKEYGVAPYWMAGKEAAEGTPERQLYEAKLQQQLSGQKTGTVPYYLDPAWLSQNRDVAQQVLESHEIFLNEDEIDNLINPTIGTSTKEPTMGSRITMISPEGIPGTVEVGEQDAYLAQGYTLPSEAATKPTSDEAIQQAQEILGILQGKKEQFYKPSGKDFVTMSPLRFLWERHKAKKLLKQRGK